MTHNAKYSKARDDIREVSTKAYKQFLEDSSYKPWRWLQVKHVETEYKDVRRTLRELSQQLDFECPEDLLQSRYSFACVAFNRFQKASGVYLPFEGCNPVPDCDHNFVP